MWSWLALAGSLALTAPAAAQQFPVLSQNPPSLRWFEIRTAHFRVLYPAGFEQRAQRTARRLEQVYEPVGASLGVRPRPVTVVLQTQNTIGNGFVSILPRRSEFFTTPPQAPSLTGTLDWLDQLAVHEYRHVVQFEKPRQGLSRVAFWLFGYGGLGATTIGVPDWFTEGDAVGTETVLTRSGRGRIPAFDVELRANLLAGRRYTYAKSVAGSYRDNVPNHYVLGYFLTSYAKRRYGPEVWGPVMNRYYQFPVYPFSFSNSLRRTTGLRVESLYQRTLAEVDSAWRQQLARMPAGPAPFYYPARPERRVFTQYQYPQYLNDSTVVALKSGLGHIDQLVLLRPRSKEQVLHVPGLVNLPEMLSAGGGKVCWPEYRYDVRWLQRVYSELKVLDVASGQVTRLTPRGRYTAAALSPDGRQLLAVRTDATYRTELVVLDASTGQQVQVLPNPGHDQFQQPRWSTDQRRAVVVTLKAAGKVLEEIDLATGQRQELLPTAELNISHPQPWGDYVFYNSPQSGTDQIYAVHTGTRQRLQVTHDSVGAYHAAISPDGQRLAFHVFRSGGSRVAELPLTPAQWQPAEAGHDPAAYLEPVVQTDPGAQKVGPVLPGDTLLLDNALPTQRYRPAAHLFNVFGWGLIQSPAGSGLSVGVRSQDVLSTLQSVAGVGYDQTERTGNAFATISYQGLYPVLDATLERGQRRTTLYIDRDDEADSLRQDRWQYTNLTLGARLPLQLTQNRFRQALTVGAYYTAQQSQGYDLPYRYLNEIGRNTLHLLSSSVSYFRLLKQSQRDVAPRWGQTLFLSARTTPFGKGLSTWQLAAQGSSYLPGLGRHHSVRVRAGYQQQNPRSFPLTAAIFYPRGQTYYNFRQLATGSAEYRLPLLHPDWTLGRWLYVPRVLGGVFYDRAVGTLAAVSPDGQPTEVWQRYATVGADVSVVFNALRLRTPFEVGARTIYNVRSGEWLVQPLVLDIGF
ncbi:hypothetical protein HER32_12150 [Hymenobacter sp. BT18]|uniref:PD40 domain-containing protein n=1 Tax=Hymenobacter sp. BT18 TaxID=2835648 RepID=UPI00143E4D65|nr:PD40 domain-containing protein [Hymenobacter sp. BT18]QIX61893.1 hypothetical protein HER32_12150 [Hymenobacter sp. BT18]